MAHDFLDNSLLQSGANVPQAQNFDDRLGQAFNSPLLQLGVNLLKAGGPTPGFSSFGQALSGAFDATNVHINSKAREELKLELLRAQIADLQRPREVKRPGITEDVAGFKRFTTGEQAGQRVFPGVQAPAAKQTAFDEKVEALVSTGIPKEIAIGIQAGQFAVSRNPQTNVAQVVDKATGSIIFDGTTPAAPPLPEAPAPPSPDISQALGASGVARATVNKIADLFGGELPFQEAGEAAAQLSNLNNEAIQLLRSGLGGRPNVQLQQRIERLLVEPNEIFGGEQEAKNKFKGVIDTIDTEAQRLENQIRIGGLRPETLDEARQKVSELKALSLKFNSVLESQETKEKGDIRRFFR